MSRTEGIHLPRLPTSHVRATTSNAVQHHPKWHKHETTLSEPHYTAYVGTPRQDVPNQVYRDAAMFDDVFDRQGRLFTGRKTPKITSPLNTLEYNSLHDPHCRRLFLNNQALRLHLTNLGLLTDDLRVIANTKEQRQKVRGHELLERKEELARKLSEREKLRIERLQRQTANIPNRYQQSILQETMRKERWKQIQAKKLEEKKKQQKVSMLEVEARKEERKRQLKEVLKSIKLIEQTQRNAYVYEQQQTELETYKRHFGQTAVWHRESDRIHNRIVYLEKTKWSKKGKQTKQPPVDKDWFSETYPKSSKTVNISLDTSSPIATIGEATPVKTPPEEMITPMSQKIVEEKVIETASSKETVHEILSDKHTDEEIDQIEKGKSEEKDRVIKDKREEEESLSRYNKDGGLILQDKERNKEDTSEDTESINKETTGEESDAPLTVPKPVKPFKLVKPVLLGQQESSVELTNLFYDILNHLDSYGTGHIWIDHFYQVMSSSDLALPLDQEELSYITDQISDQGWIPLIEATNILPVLLNGLFQQRLREQIEQYGGYIEDRWLQLVSPNIGYIFMDKTTGLVQRGGRPLDYRPYLKDDWFEDVIVELFETADKNRDGYVDQNEIHEFLQSPVVNSRVYAHQLDELFEVFIDRSVEGVMTLEQFVQYAHVILQMIYCNSYPDDEWIELESRKCGKYLFNPSTGETKLPETSEDTADTPSAKTRRKRKNSKRKEERKESASSKPPPLRMKSGASIKSGKEEGIDTTTDQSDGSIKMESVSINSNESGEDISNIAEQIAERLQKGLHIIETIPEEEEEQQERKQGNAMPINHPPSTSGDGVSVDDTIDEILQKVIDERENQDN